MEALPKFVHYNKLLLFVWLLTFARAQLGEIYEPVGPVCHGKCDCQNKSDALLLNCTNRGMTLVLSQWPPHPKHLIASFSGNNISELLQMPQSDAKTISLSFSHCGIRSLASAMFIDATGIEFLDLSWNLLTGLEIRGEVFRGRYSNQAFEPISLTQLDLSHNLIESLGYSAFEHTPHLQRLNLNHNPLRVLDPQTSHAVSSVLSLQALQLVNTSLKTLPTDVFARLRNLREVDLSENQLERVPETLAHLSASLEKLRIGGNLMKILEDHDFMGLHKLREVNISGMSALESIYHNTFAYLPELRVLHCENNRKLHHIHEHAFGPEGHIPRLQELYLTNCNLETLPPSLLHWENLTVLSLSGNRWLCDCQLFQTISAIHNTSSDIISPEASCSSPVEVAGIGLDELQSLEDACKDGLEAEEKEYRISSLHNVIMKTVLVISVVMLTMVACFVFWKVMIRYNTLRALNTMYPVLYVSAPTTEN